MKKILFLFCTCCVVGFCSAQNLSVTGNYAGVMGELISTIEIRQNHKFVITAHHNKDDKKVQTISRGKWTLEGDKLFLKDRSGKVTMLLKYRNNGAEDLNVIEKFEKDAWYLADKMGFMRLATFYHADPNEILIYLKEWCQLKKGAGC